MGPWQTSAGEASGRQHALGDVYSARSCRLLLRAARPPKRVIQRRIENELAMRLLQGEFGEGATVRVDATPAGELTFTPLGEAVPA